MQNAIITYNQLKYCHVKQIKHELGVVSVLIDEMWYQIKENENNGQYQKKNITWANNDINDDYYGNGIDNFKLGSLMKNKYKYEIKLYDKYKGFLLGWNKEKNVKCIKKVPANKINIPLRGFHVN